MARGNRIVVSADPMGKWFEGFVATGNTFKPGVCVQIQPATALKAGCHTCELYNADADGGNPKGPHIIVVEDYLSGLVPASGGSYAAGERFFGYIPEHGDQLNLLLGDVAGTADDHTKGEILIIDDTTGKFIATTGSPEREVAQLLETVTDPVADTLAWCLWEA